MRLIDADALKLSMMLIAPGETKKYCYPCREILKAIDDAPTIEERKTGKWIHQKYHCNDPDGETIFVELVSCQCSECGLYVQQPCNFCPNCGADMRGKEHDKG